MARGVYSAAIVLVLATIAYENNENCTRECQLAVSMHIPVIKLLVDKKINNSNWLSTLLSSSAKYKKAVPKGNFIYILNM